MSSFFSFVLVTLAVLMVVYLYRVVRGPSVFDRVLGLNGISTKAIVLLVVIGTLFERVDMFGVQDEEFTRGLNLLLNRPVVRKLGLPACMTILAGRQEVLRWPRRGTSPASQPGSG